MCMCSCLAYSSLRSALPLLGPRCMHETIYDTDSHWIGRSTTTYEVRRGLAWHVAPVLYVFREKEAADNARWAILEGLLSERLLFPTVRVIGSSRWAAFKPESLSFHLCIGIRIGPKIKAQNNGPPAKPRRRARLRPPLYQRNIFGGPPARYRHVR